MAKIVLIGAGSHVFSKHLITDILTYPELRESTITLMDIVPESLTLISDFANQLINQNGFSTIIETTTNRREALYGANYVFITIRVGERMMMGDDRRIVLKYGVEDSPDTIGAGGIFYGIRHAQVILDICRDMEELCPNAWLFNYTNPMAINTWAIDDFTKIRNIGLCHSVVNTSIQLSKYLGVPHEEISYWVAGINHMAWFLELKWRGDNAYPLLRERFNDPDVYTGKDTDDWHVADIVRAEIFKTFGYYVTESSMHMGTYVPYFKKRPDLIKKFKLVEHAFDPGNDSRGSQDELLRQQINRGYQFPLVHSGEYGSIIIHSLETGNVSRINGNVKNNGLITNLPKGCCVEVPCMVDKEGIHPCYVGDLPPQLAALNRTNINVQDLAVHGIVEKDKTKIYQAILLDPLTSSILTIEETRDMVHELFLANKEYLNGFK